MITGKLFRKNRRSRNTSEFPDEQEIVRRAQDGDKESYRLLVEKYQKRAFAIAFEVTRSKEDAEDIVQDAFVKAYMSLPNFKGESAFYTWLYRIVYNLSIDAKRKKARRGGDNVEYDESGNENAPTVSKTAESPFIAPHEALQRKEEVKRIHEALGKLSEEHRAIILLRDVEGFSYDEIAETLKIQSGTVMSRIFYARQQLRRTLADLDPYGPADVRNPLENKVKKFEKSLNKDAPSDVSNIARRKKEVL